ncbi:NACHT domain-containing protein [Streptomyces sp. NPDC101118]|uniref:NACHT domain-containing protein n=1 Tax=Streptomyces sp. NPDC101118 TaxID=3366109 RepID=UPI003806120B
MGDGGSRLRGHGGTVLRAVAAACSVALVLARPRLPVPHPYDGLAAEAGWVLLCTAVVYEIWARLRARARRRRSLAWRSPRHLDRAAEALAEGLASRYALDRRSRTSGPEPISVTWSYTGGTHAPALDADTSSAARFFRAVPHGRLVVLGGAGAGKTFLALGLARDLLLQRQEGAYDRVPALVPLASWDPSQGLLTWVSEQLAAAHPEACAPVPGAPPAEVAFQLLRTGRVLPVLDGFDELPGPVREEAFRQLTEDLGAVDGPFVLTSRGPAYRRQAHAHRTFQRTEVTLDGLTDDALDDYLGRDRPSGEPWDAVLDQLRQGSTREARRLRRVLRVPLMVELARVAYGTGGGSPAELVEPGRFSGRRELERHLYDAFLAVVYSGSRDDRERWGRETARSWTEFLARRMRDANRQEFAWWRLDEEVPRLVRALRYLPAFAVMGVVCAGPAFEQPWWNHWVAVPAWPVWLVLSAAVLLLVSGSAGSARRVPPQRLVRPTARMVREALAKRPVRVTVLLVGAVLAVGWPVAAAVGGSALGWITVVSVVVPLWWTNVALPVLWRPADPARASSPADLLRSDRRSVLLLGWLAPQPRIAAEDGLFALLSVPVAAHVLWQVSAGRDLASARDWLFLGVTALTSWTLYSVAVSAWGRYVPARLWLAAAGQLPWRLMPFLADASRRDVLRQAGGAYRFRHLELRNRLAETAHAEPAGPARRNGGRPPFSFARYVPAGLAALTLMVTATGPLRDGRLPGPVRAAPDACALLDARDLAVLVPGGVGRAGKDGPDGDVCRVVAASPYAPDAEVTIGTTLLTGYGEASASGLAAQRFEAVRKTDSIGTSGAEPWAVLKPVAGLGDEAYSVAGRFGPDVRVRVRVGNLLLEVEYEDEYAEGALALHVAETLARNALRRAGLGAHAGRPMSLADVSRPAVPTPNRFTLYKRDAARGPALYGATWGAAEPSRLWIASGVPFVLRAPRGLSCTALGAPEPLDMSCEPSYTAAKFPDGVAARIDVAVDRCTGGCTQDRTRAFFERLPESRTLRWQRGPVRNPRSASSTFFATAPGRGEPGEVDGANTHRMYLLRQLWTQDRPDAPYRGWVMWVRVEVPPGHESLAQKVVNDVYGQTGGDTY